MSFKSVSSYEGLKVYADRKTRTVHRTATATPACRLDEISDGIKFFPRDTLGEAHRYRYKNCPHCIGPTPSRRPSN